LLQLEIRPAAVQGVEKNFTDGTETLDDVIRPDLGIR
jgi:hypothetical protein